MAALAHTHPANARKRLSALSSTLAGKTANLSYPIGSEAHAHDAPDVFLIHARIEPPGPSQSSAQTRASRRTRELVNGRQHAPNTPFTSPVNKTIRACTHRLSELSFMISLMEHLYATAVSPPLLYSMHLICGAVYWRDRSHSISHKRTNHRNVRVEQLAVRGGGARQGRGAAWRLGRGVGGELGGSLGGNLGRTEALRR